MYLFFFFSSRRRHTRLQGDWSSDVCSSDLMMRRDDSVSSEDICLVDPAERQAGTATSVNLLAISDDAKLMADRKSTRLNSSHLVISYAVFCLKKKKNSM